jgi:prepilin-type N-terminal cleavage/methylation domain-containing protein
MKIPTNKSRAFTLIELLVVISIIGILIAIAVPNIAGALMKAHLTDSLANARALQHATLAMTMDSQQAGEGLQWTFTETNGESTPVTLAQYFSALTTGGYLADSELRSLLSAPGKNPSLGNYPAEAIAFTVYQVSDTSPSDQVFLTSANINPPSGGMNAKTQPFGDKGFVFFTKSGSGGIRTRIADATSTNVFPTSGDHQYIPLK